MKSMLKRRRFPDEKISAIVPCYNESPNILLMYKRLSKTLRDLIDNWEIVFVDNGSMDSSSEIFSKLTKNDRRVTVIQLSRNFYKSQGAYSAGLDYVNCDAAVLLDGDLQDPPELIPKMVELWKRGYDVVYGVRK